MADLNPELIAKVALELVNEKGADAFSLRSVAQRLGVTPMAIYHHVNGISGLAELVVDASLSDVPTDPGSGDWKDDLWTIAEWARENLARNPEVAQLRRAHRVWTEGMAKLNTAWVSDWKRSGLPEGAIPLAATSSSMTIFGLLNEGSLMLGRQLAGDMGDAISERARRLLTDEDGQDELFEFSVRALIDGVYERALKTEVSKNTTVQPAF